MLATLYNDNECSDRPNAMPPFTLRCHPPHVADFSAPGEGALYRSRDNPSSRVLLESRDAANNATKCDAFPMLKRRGPLVRALRESGGGHDYSFVTLPVVW